MPVDRYDTVLDDLEGAGKVLERRAKAQDVTDQVVDVDSRINSQRASVARVRELMDKATKLSDVVTLEGELSTREADLESLLAREAVAEGPHQPGHDHPVPVRDAGKPAAQEEDGPGFVDALAGGWEALVTMVRWLAVAIGAVLPFAAVAVRSPWCEVRGRGPGCRAAGPPRRDDRARPAPAARRRPGRPAAAGARRRCATGD